MFSLIQPVAGAAIALLTLLPVAVAAWLIATLVVYYPVEVFAPAFFAIVPATMIVFALWVAFCKKLVHPSPRAGVYKVYSFKYLQHWLSGVVMQIVHTVGLPVFTTVYLPAWMRLLGARLGRHTEMSTVWRINPDMLTAGDGVFFADGCMIGGARTHLGRFEVARNEIGDRTLRRQQRDVADRSEHRQRLPARRPVGAAACHAIHPGQHRLAGVSRFPPAQQAKGVVLRSQADL